MNSRFFAAAFLVVLIAPGADRGRAAAGTSAIPWACGGLQPRVSPDGAAIAVSYQGALAVLPAAGGPLRVLTRDEGWDVSPAWSPDGERIAYIAAPGFTAGTLRLLEVKSGGEVKLPARVTAQGPLWFHPFGGRVLGRFAPGGAGRVISWCDLATGKVTPVRGIPDNWAMRLRAAFAPSPDGRWIYYAEHFDREGEQGGNNGPQAEVFRIAAEGGAPEKLFEWPARIYELCATPDGAGLVAVTDAGVAYNDLWLVPFAAPNRGARQLTHGQADEDSPSVPGDGRALFFTDNREGATGLVRLNLDDGTETRIAPTTPDHGLPLATLRVRLSDARTGEPYAARVSVKRPGGKFFAPAGAKYHLTAGLGHFISRGDAVLRLPGGNYEVRVFRGPEFHADLTEVNLTAGAGEHVIHPANTRWVNLAQRGWYSGENHIHANYGYGAWHHTPRSIRDWCEAEDLNVANLVVANSDGNGVFDRQFFRGAPDPLSDADTILWWNEEFRSTLWGHMTLFHLKQVVEPVFTGFKNTTNPWDVPTSGEIARRTRWQDGAAGYTHPTNNKEDFYDQPYSAKGLPVDVALGLVDCADFMGVVYENALPFWYELLNCGFQLPASAGTDCFLNRVTALPPGWGRVYVHLPGGLDYAKWVEGVKAGRSFVSNGPVIEFQVNDSKPGDTLRLAQPGRVRVSGRVESPYPLEVLEVIHNGRVVQAVKCGGPRVTRIEAEVPLDESGWLALRASGKAVRFWPGRTQAAHTNPIHLQIAGRPQDTAKSAQFFLKWIDRLETQLRARDRVPAAEQADVRRHLELAREVYRGRLRPGSPVRSR